MSSIYFKLKQVAIALLIFLIIGTVGYKIIAPNNTLFDCFYMVVITIATIGYGEIVVNNPATPESMFAIRLFTIFIALVGIGILTYLLSSIAAFIIEGELKETFKLKYMEKKIKSMENHYIICGLSPVGLNIANELFKTKRDFIFTDTNKETVNKTFSNYKDYIGLTGDITDDNFLIKLGVQKASGVFITTNDDNLNLVIALSVRNLNKNTKIIAMCNDNEYIPKLKIVGVDKIISPSLIGGLRMASEMIRPTVTNFLDEMMRGIEINLRVEEIKLSNSLAGKNFSEIKTDDLPNTIVMAIKENNNWVFNPPKNHIILPDSTMIVMTSPEERIILEKKYS